MDLLSQGLSRSFPNCYTLSDNMPSLLDRPSRQRTLYYETETSISQLGATSARLHWPLPFLQLESPPERPSSSAENPPEEVKTAFAVKLAFYVESWAS